MVWTRGKMTQGRILWACVIEFAEAFLHKYTYCLDCVLQVSFERIGGEAKSVPEECESLL